MGNVAMRSIRHIAARGLVWLLVAVGLIGAPAARADDQVKIGVNGVISDVVFYIAQSHGFFAQQQIRIATVSFDSGPKMIAPLGTGELDVVAGAVSAGLFNAVVRGVDIKIVADKGSMAAGRHYTAVLVRKDLVESGRFHGYADLKGWKIGEAGPGGTPGSTLNEALRTVGLSYGDVEHVYLGYPQQVAALTNRAIDAAVITEPSATMAIRAGVAIRVSDDRLYPDQQVAALLYGGDFIRQRPLVAQHFMNAYLQAARLFNDAIAPGHLTGPGADEIIGLIAANTEIKDADLIRQMIPNGIDPDGRVNKASLATDLAFYREQKYVTAPVTVDAVVDASFAEAAVAALGHYRPRN
jgi:NitT/TauT family transport system substrate-binding protein